jgi:hypothetical protein
VGGTAAQLERAAVPERAGNGRLRAPAARLQ